VTFQSPDTYRNCIRDAIRIFSQGGDSAVLSEDFDEAERQFRDSLIGLRYSAPKPEAVLSMSISQKRSFVKAFQQFDSDFKQFRSFTKFEEVDLEKDYHILAKEIEDYCSFYKNAVEELKHDNDNIIDGGGGEDNPGGSDVDLTYELVSYSKEQIDYEYIIALMGRYFSQDPASYDAARREEERKTIENSLAVFEKTHAKAGAILRSLWEKALQNPDEYKNENLMVIYEQTKENTINSILNAFAKKWCIGAPTVRYVASQYYEGEESIPNPDMIRDDSDFDAYLAQNHEPMRKFAYLKAVKDELKAILDEEIIPLRDQE
jgi:type I restriction enzyme R subunit